ncbi:MAG: tyrosine-type recombinase/integrase [Lawsonibacter sp.]|nr:tyrosine-type recombinase/integrase [Lawsonibacter sp.]
MEERILKAEQLEAYIGHLRQEERARGTIEKYLRDLRAFFSWMGGRPVDRGAAAEWKALLLERGDSPSTVNVKLSALNGFFKFMGWEENRVKFLRIQRRAFRDQDRELTRPEYVRLLAAARAEGRDRLELLMEAICSTGIRVSEVRFLTVEAVRRSRAEVRLKGKIRTILIPGKLASKLLKYARKKKIASGEIFLTRSGRSLSRRQIWREMKGVCVRAGVEAGKVFPHNLRHLFAASFYQASRDIVKLADVLGHSSIETTRIYLMTSGAEHARYLDRLGLVT